MQVILCRGFEGRWRGGAAGLSESKRGNEAAEMRDCERRANRATHGGRPLGGGLRARFGCCVRFLRHSISDDLSQKGLPPTNQSQLPAVPVPHAPQQQQPTGEPTAKNNTRTQPPTHSAAAADRLENSNRYQRHHFY